MIVDSIKINPKLLKPLMETLDFLEEDKRIGYIDSLLIDVDQTIEKAQNYAQLEKVDYITALRQVITKEGNYNEPQISSTEKNQIYYERAKYLLNVDELLFERYNEQVPGKKIGTQSESPRFWKNDNFDLVKKISVVDEIFESKEYQTYLELTRPGLISERLKHKLKEKKDINLDKNFNLHDY